MEQEYSKNQAISSGLGLIERQVEQTIEHVEFARKFLDAGDIEVLDFIFEDLNTVRSQIGEFLVVVLYSALANLGASYCGKQEP